MLTISIIHHEGYALEKDFYVILKNPVGSIELGEPNLARITIIDDDGNLWMLSNNQIIYTDNILSKPKSTDIVFYDYS